MSAFDGIIARWQEKRIELARYRAQVDGAALADEILQDLAELAGAEAPVSLGEASRRTGYTSDHLSRLIRAGTLPNYGRKHAPRVRLSECPTKSALTKRPAYAYDADADARSLGARR